MSICCVPTYFQPEGATHTLCATRCSLTASAPPAPAGAPPVLLCHGLGSNRNTYLLPAHRNIVHMLLEGGWDVWLAELRGHGLSKAGADWDSPWDVNDYISDACSFVAFVSGQTSGASVHWIGHSLGGIIGIAMASLQPPPPLASVVAVAAGGVDEEERGQSVVVRVGGGTARGQEACERARGDRRRGRQPAAVRFRGRPLAN